MDGEAFLTSQMKDIPDFRRAASKGLGAKGAEDGSDTGAGWDCSALVISNAISLTRSKGRSIFSCSTRFRVDAAICSRIMTPSLPLPE